MKHNITEEEKKRQIEQMWADYDKANRIQSNSNYTNNREIDFFDEGEEISTTEPVRYEKLSEGKNHKQGFKKNNRRITSKKFDNSDG